MMQCGTPGCKKPATQAVAWQVQSARSPGFWYGCDPHAAAFATKREERDELIGMTALLPDSVSVRRPAENDTANNSPDHESPLWERKLS